MAAEASGLITPLLATTRHVRAPTTRRAPVGAGAHRNRKEKVVPTEVATRSIKRESANLGWRRASPFFFVGGHSCPRSR